MMDTTIRIASWTIVAGSLLVIGRTLFVTVLSDLELPEVDPLQTGGTVMQAPAEPDIAPALDTLAVEPVEAHLETPPPALPEEDVAEDDEGSIVLNAPG